MAIQGTGSSVGGTTAYPYTQETGGVDGQQAVGGTGRTTGSTSGSTDVPDPKNQSGFKTDKPALTAPDSGALTLNNLQGALGATLSFGALAMALIQESTSELIRDNRDITYDAGMQSADLLEDQADKMREQAVIQLVCGVVQGAIQFGSGLFQFVSSTKTLLNSMKGLQNVSQPNQPGQNGTNPTPGSTGSTGTTDTTGSTGSAESAPTAESKLDKKLRLAELEHQNTIDQLQHERTSGIATAANSFGTLAQTIGKGMETFIEADIKDLEAQQKRIDTYREQIQSITESLQDTVKQAISSMSTISQSMVESNKRILG